MSTMSSSELKEIKVIDQDLIDAVCLCHAGLAVDAPYNEQHYLNVVLNILFGYLTKDGRKEVEAYLDDKKYRTDPDIIIAKQ